MSGKMKAVVFEAPFELSMKDVDIPRIEDGKDALVKVSFAAICGSDLHPYRGAEKGLQKGTVMGHEFVGKVVEVGQDVAAIAVGDLVVAPFTTCCGECYFCENKLSCRCEKGRLFGWISESNQHGLHGGQAEYVRVPLADSTLFKLEADANPRKSLLLGDILATGFYCAFKGGVKQLKQVKDAVVVVIGCGPVGLLAIASARQLGGSNVTIIAVDCVKERLETAEKLGATTSLNFKTEDVPRLVKERSASKHGAEVVLEVVGQPSAMRLAFDCLRPGGNISSVGVHAYEKNEISPIQAYDKNITFCSGRCPVRSLLSDLETKEEMLNVLSNLDEKLFFTHTVPIQQVVDMYKVFDTQSDGIIKCLIDFPDN